VKSVEENKQLELLEKIIEIMNSEGVSKEIKERLIKSVSDLYKETLTPTYED
jgi:uncharacterized tellurite resistance protein B-like protein